MPMLLAVYDKVNLKSEVAKAISTYQVKNGIYVTLLGCKSDIGYFGEPNKKDVTEYLRDSYFYKQVMAL